jgi:predicted dehydrogenase
MFDMGPYYLTTLVNLLGPARRVTGASKRTFEQRTAGHETIKGQVLPVSVATHITGSVDFHSGAIATVVMSFDVWRHNLPVLEIYGTQGTLAVADPNTFGGPVRVWEVKTGEWRELALAGRADIQRGVGVVDMARSISSGEPHRASGELAAHVVELMAAFEIASGSQQHVPIQSHPAAPAVLLL